MFCARWYTQGMQNYTWKDAVILGCVLVIVALSVENSILKTSLRGSEGVYNRFLSVRVKGQPLTELVNRQTLTVVPQGNEAIVCGLVGMEPAKKYP